MSPIGAGFAALLEALRLSIDQVNLRLFPTSVRSSPMGPSDVPAHAYLRPICVLYPYTYLDPDPNPDLGLGSRPGSGRMERVLPRWNANETLVPEDITFLGRLKVK